MKIYLNIVKNALSNDNVYVDFDKKFRKEVAAEYKTDNAWKKFYV